MVNNKMKKIYNQPTCLVVVLSAGQIMLSESLTINTTYDPADESTYVSSSEQVLTKENKSIWDSEW